MRMPPFCAAQCKPFGIKKQGVIKASCDNLCIENDDTLYYYILYIIILSLSSFFYFFIFPRFRKKMMSFRVFIDISI